MRKSVPLRSSVTRMLSSGSSASAAVFAQHFLHAVDQAIQLVSRLNLACLVHLSFVVRFECLLRIGNGVLHVAALRRRNRPKRRRQQDRVLG
jgi:hypothetical protein